MLTVSANMKKCHESLHLIVQISFVIQNIRSSILIDTDTKVKKNTKIQKETIYLYNETFHALIKSFEFLKASNMNYLNKMSQ